MIPLAVAALVWTTWQSEKDKDVPKIVGTASKGDDEAHHPHRGIGGRNFRREFTLAEHVDVHNAELKNGMLNIHLKREVPEELQPKKIKINEGLTIEGSATDK